MGRYDFVLSLVKDGTLDFGAACEGLLSPFATDMKQTVQSNFWHAEGNVLNHTKMVAEALIQIPYFKAADERLQAELLLAALLHDIGKPSCTKIEDGAITTPHHATTGSLIARDYLWRTLGMCGNNSEIPQVSLFRETVCLLIRYHTLPFHVLDRDDYELKLCQIASNGNLAPDFNLKMLFTLCEADMNGRLYINKSNFLDYLRLCEMCADGNEYLNAPYKFKSQRSAFLYLSGKQAWRDAEIYDDTWGEVVMLSGLPGTGKDTWIEQNLPSLPMISLDNIRLEYKVAPTENSRFIATQAKERAKELLRKKQPFVWNATNLSASIRGKLIALFHAYGASVRIVFLETEWNEELRRNENRNAVVPVSVIEKMLRSATLPECFEAECVEWLTV